MGRIRGKATAVGSVILLGALTLGAAAFSVTNVPRRVPVTPLAQALRHHSLSAPCGPPPPQRATAVDVTAAGKIGWTARLTPDNQNTDNDNVEPVVAGADAYFAQAGSVRAIDRANGRSSWSWNGGQTVYGMWVWHGLVAVLTDQVSDHARLSGLDEGTGAVRWQLSIRGSGVLGTPQVTTDGGLAWMRTNGDLQVVDLADGRIRWSLSEGRQAIPITSNGIVLTGRNGVLTAWNDETGRRQWTLPGFPLQQSDEVVDHLVLVTSSVVQPSLTTALTAVDPRTGRIVWHFDPGTALAVLSAGPAGVAVATYVPDRRLYLLDPQNGIVQWQANTAVTLDTIPMVLSHDVISIEGGVEGYPGINLVDRGASNGQAKWSVRLQGSPTGKQPVLRSGSLVVVEASGANGSASLFAFDMATGALTWRSSMPEFVQIAPVVAERGFLVQAATVGYGCAL
jgi:outer membrane protein assembly factor BamB